MKNGYRFREVICPFCKHRYMTQIYYDYDLTVTLPDKSLKGWITMCPVCSSFSFAAEGILEGFDRNQFPAEAIEEKITLRSI